MLGERSDQRGLWEADRLYLDHVGRESFYGVLASLRGRLFRDADFAEFYCPDNGRDSVPPSLLATALLLQSHDKVSDAEAKARADFDLRWKVALGIEVEDRPFAKSTLQVFRAQLILHGKVREVFESSLRLARESGFLKGRGMRVALDTTNILGRGAVKDTCNLLADGIVKLLRALAQLKGINVGEWAKSQGYHRYHRYLGSSVKGEAAIDWSDRQAQTALLSGIVADADRLLELSRQAQGELREDSDERQRIVAAAELLGQLLLQDVERAEGGMSLKDGVSRDRMMSVHDPEMRHGHKSSSRRFDGHKAAIVVDTDSQLITAVEVLPGNAPDNLGALELVEQSEANTGVPVEEAMGDAAYGDGGTRQTFADAGRTLIARVPGRPNRTHFPTSILTWRRVPAPVRRGMLPGRWCRRDGAPAKRVELTVWRPSDSTRRSAGYAPCGPSAWRQNRVRDERCNCTRRKRCCSRPAPYSRARPLPSTGSVAWWWSTGWRGWSNWGSASPATSAVPKPGSSCTWQPPWPT